MKLKRQKPPIPVELLYGVLTICMSVPAHALPVAPLSNPATSSSTTQATTTGSDSAELIRVKSGGFGGGGFGGGGGGFRSGGSFGGGGGGGGSSFKYTSPSTSYGSYGSSRGTGSGSLGSSLGSGSGSGVRAPAPAAPAAPAPSSPKSGGGGWLGWGNSAPATPKAAPAAPAPAAPTSPAMIGYGGQVKATLGSQPAASQPAMPKAAAPAAPAPAAPAPAAPKASGGSWWNPRSWVGGGSNSTPTTMKARQGGIGGTYKDLDVSKAKPLGFNKYEHTLDNGDKLRFKQHADGTQTILSRTKNDPKTGAVTTYKYNSKSGKQASAKSVFPDGSTRETRIRPDGTKRVVKNLADGTRIVSDTRRGGFVERAYVSGGVSYTSRTYFNRRTGTTYVTHYYHDPYGYAIYAPSYHFSYGYYGAFYAPYSPWHAPIYYPYYSGWSWYPSPWLFNPYSPYSYYFTPYPTYASPVDWLTDYIIADTLNSYYEGQVAAQDAAVRAQNQVLQNEVNSLQNQVNNLSDAQIQNDLNARSQRAVISPDVKAQIASQLRNEVRAQQDQKSVPMASVLQDTKYLFLVSDEVDLSTEDANECTLDEGDIFKLVNPVDPNGSPDAVAQIRVVTAKKSDSNCRAGTTAYIAVSTLQEMKNRLSERAEAGMKAMSEHQGQNSLPTLSADAPQMIQPNDSAAQDVRRLQGIDQ